MKLNCMNDSWFTIFMIIMRECYYMYKQLCIKIKGANNLAICVLDFRINWRATCSQKLITGCRYLTSYSQKNASNTVNINGDILHIWILLNTALWNHYMYLNNVPVCSNNKMKVLPQTWIFISPKRSKKLMLYPWHSICVYLKV